MNARRQPPRPISLGHPLRPCLSRPARPRERTDADGSVAGRIGGPSGRLRGEDGSASRSRPYRADHKGCALAAAGFDVAEHDESFSTVEAEEVLLAADLSRARRKQVVDKLAAAVILQRWLDGRRAPTPDETSKHGSPR
jgi:hypothetical protein